MRKTVALAVSAAVHCAALLLITPGSAETAASARGGSFVAARWSMARGGEGSVAAPLPRRAKTAPPSATPDAKSYATPDATTVATPDAPMSGEPNDADRSDADAARAIGEGERAIGGDGDEAGTRGNAASEGGPRLVKAIDVLVARLAAAKVYPEAARMRGAQGTVVLSASFDASGALVEATILRSSGSSILDRAALALLRSVAPVVADDLPAVVTVEISYRLE